MGIERFERNHSARGAALFIVAVMLAALFNEPLGAKQQASSFDAGKLAFGQAHYDFAREKFEQAAQASPRNITAQYYLALASAYAKDYKTAQKAMARVIALSTPGSDVYKNGLQFFKNMQHQLGPLEPYTASDDGRLVRWDSKIMPIRVCITPGLQLPAAYSGDDFTMEKYLQIQDLLKQPAFYARLALCPYYEPAWAGAVAGGLNEWNWAISENVLDFVLVPKPEQADIIVFWCPTMAGYSGKTYFATGGAKIVIQICTKLDDAFPKWVKPTLIENSAAHEFGHAWGLQSHSPNIKDCMSADHELIEIHRNGIGRIQTGLSPNDRVVLRALYQLPPDQYLTRLSSAASKLPRSTPSRKHAR